MPLGQKFRSNTITTVVSSAIVDSHITWHQEKTFDSEDILSADFQTDEQIMNNMKITNESKRQKKN